MIGWAARRVCVSGRLQMGRLVSSLRLGETKVRVVPSANYDSQDGSTLHQYFSRKPHCWGPVKAAILCNVL